VTATAMILSTAAVGATRRPPAALAALAGLALLAALAGLAAPAAAQPDRLDDLELDTLTAPEPDPDWLEGIGENELVLIHGLGANKSIWHRVTPFLVNTFNLRLYELHGHGETAPLESPTIAREAEALGDWLQEQGLVYPTLVGHGLGGMVAMQYAFDHPGDVKRLVVIDAAPRQLASDEQKAAVAEALLADYDRFVASRYLNISREPEIGDQAVDMALRTDSATFASLLLDSFSWDLTAELPNQAIPLLVIGSEAFLPEAGNERAYLTEYGYADARALAFKRLEGTGHYMMLEKPTYLGSVITVWLREG